MFETITNYMLAEGRTLRAAPITSVFLVIIGVLIGQWLTREKLEAAEYQLSVTQNDLDTIREFRRLFPDRTPAEVMEKQESLRKLITPNKYVMDKYTRDKD